MKKCVFATVIAVLALAAPAGAGADAPSFVAAHFVITPGALSDVDLDLAISADNPAPAKIVIYVPQGYGLSTVAPAGTTVGTIDATASAGGTSLNIPTGNIVADNPANYATNPAAQACAPGTHAAVWVAHVATFVIPIYVDPTSSVDSSLGGYKMQTCLTAPEATNPQVRLIEAQINLTQTVLTNPSSANDYLWRVLVTPYVAGTTTPNASATYELRSDVLMPGTLTLKKSGYNKKTKRATLTGRFLLLGHAISGVPILIFSIASNGSVKLAAQARTNKKGIYTTHLRLTKTTRLQALVPDGQGTCDTSVASPAPAGCLTETTTPYFSNLLKATPK